MMSATPMVAVAVLAVVAGAVAAAWSFGARAQQGPATASVTIDQSRFQPDQVTVRRGGIVTWRNRDLVPHTVTFRDADWNSSELVEGASWTLTIPTVGRWSYYCTYHPDMTGTVAVAD